MSKDFDSRIDPPHGGGPRYARRLSDKILIAFHAACDQGEREIAAQLLNVLEFMIKQSTKTPDQRERRSQENLVAAHERLWALRHPDRIE